MSGKQTIVYEISTSARDDGTLEAVYIRLMSNKVAKTREIQEDVLLADYDRNGNLVGLEILAPVKFSDLASLVDKPRKTPFKRFVTESAPSAMVVC